MALINVYAPNDHNIAKEFYVNLLNNAHQFGIDFDSNVVLAGDLNVVLDEPDDEPEDALAAAAACAVAAAAGLRPSLALPVVPKPYLAILGRGS